MELIVPGDRLVFVKFHMSGNRLFQKRHVKLNTTNKITYGKESEDKIKEMPVVASDAR